MACLANAGSIVALAGTNQAYQYTNAPLATQTADCQAKYTAQVVDNRNDIYINQPIINDRNHYINNINRQLIRDNNYYHYQKQDLYRDNTINRYFNQVYRKTQNFASCSSSCGVIPGSSTCYSYGNAFCGCL